MHSERETLEKLSIAAADAKMSRQRKQEIWIKIERESDSVTPIKIKTRRGFQMFKTTAAAIAMLAIVGGGIGYSIHHTAPTPGQNTPVTTASHGKTPQPALGHIHHKSTSASRSRNEVMVPNLIGMSVQGAGSILAGVGLKLVPSGTKQQRFPVASHILSQGVAAGTLVPRGTKIHVTFGSSQ